MGVVVGTDGVYEGGSRGRRSSVPVVVRRRRAVVGGVGDLVVVLAFPLVVAVMVAMEAVRHVAGGARRRVIAEEVSKDPQEAVHRKGL